MENESTFLGSILRLRADKLLKSRSKKKESTHSIAETLSLIHELEVHQIELEMQNDELETKNIELINGNISHNKAEKYSNLYDFAPLGYFSLTKEGKIVDLNLHAAHTLGQDRLYLIDSMFGFFVKEESKPVFNSFLEKVFNSNFKVSCEVEIFTHDSHTSHVLLTGIYSVKEELCFISSVDINERKQSEKYREMNREILQILNGQGDIKDLIHRIVIVLKDFTGIDSVGIRLQYGADFPYFDSIGFPKEFIQMENTMMVLDKQGKICLDKKGNPLLACTCGLVLSGNASCKSNPLVTVCGSWWTNNSFPILEIPSVNDDRFQPRNHCIHQGYASVALVPIRINSVIEGLLQFNDKQKDRFNSNTIEFFEGIASHIGSAMMRKQAEETLRKNEELLRTITENAPDIIVQLDRDGTILYMNRSLPGYSMEESIGKNFCEWTLGEYHAIMKQSLELTIKESSTQTYLSRIKDKQGEISWYRSCISPVKQAEKVINAVMVTRDITDSILSSEILRESEENRNAIIETAMDGFWIFDLQGCFLEVNDTYCRMSGYSKAELLSMKIQDIEVSENAEEIASHLRKNMEVGEDRFETQHRCKDGRIIDVEVNVQYRPVNGGRFVTFLHDITERKIDEKKLLQSKERYKSLFENNHAVLVLLNPENGQIVDANPSACNFYGWSHQEMCLKNISEIDTLSREELITKFQQSKKGKYSHLILKHRLATGELRDVEAYTGPIQFDETILLFSIVHDITERKKAQAALRKNEERYSLIYNSSRDSIFSFDFNGTITSANRSFCEELKLGLSQVIGHTLTEVGVPDFLSNELYQLKKEVKETNNTIITEMKVPLSDGRFRFYEIVLNPLHDEKGKIVGIGGSARNITKRKEAYQALKESEKMFRYLVKDITVGVILYGPSEEVIMCNPKALDLLGITELQLKDNTYFEQGWDSIREGGSTFFQSDFPVQLAFENGHSIHDVVMGVRPLPTSDITWLLVNAEVLLKDDRSIRNVVCSFIDITLIKKAENDLRDSEQRLKYHFENSPLAIVELNNDQRVTQWSLEAENIFGWKKEEVIGSRFDSLNLISGEDIPLVVESMRRLTNREVDTTVTTHRNVTKSGHILECTWYNSILFDRNGEIASVMSLVQDITLRKQAEDALRRLNEDLEDRVIERTSELLKSNEAIKIAEEKYRTVSDFAFNWEYWTDTFNQMIYCSPSCERITGYKSTEFEQKSQLMFDIIYPDDLALFQEHRNKEVRTQESDHEFQYRIIRKDGTIRWIGHFSRPVFDDLGNFCGIRGSNEDITAKKKMEELLTTSNQKYKLLSENITDGIFICKNGRFEYANKAIYDIFGYQGREMEKMKLTHLVIIDFHEELEKFLYSNDPENRSCTLELDCLRKDFNMVIVEILLNYVSKDKMVYGVVHDITEKKLQQKNMLKAIIQTEEKERAHFSKELHDGLGPLLSTIKLYLQWSERPNSNRSHEEIIGKAGEILEEALATVKEISNKLSPHLLTNYGLNSAIRSFVDKLSETSSFNIIFESNMSRRIDIEIEAALYRAIIECINNTLKYAQANNIYIELNDSFDQIQIIYKDDGTGFNVTETLTKHKGLGLFNLMNRLNTIGGKVDLTSEPGKGVNYLFSVNV